MQNQQQKSTLQNPKVASFKNQIRNNHRQQIFTQKRQILNQKYNLYYHQHSQQNSYQNKSSLQQQQLQQQIKQLQLLYQKLKNMQSIPQAIIQLGNLLAQQNLLNQYLIRKESEGLRKYCVNLVYLLFNVSIPKLSPYYTSNIITNQNLIIRKNCLIIVSNILADRNSPKEELIPIISQGLQTIYGSVSEYGNTVQIVEIGWILGNIFCHNIKIVQNQLQKPYQILLSWVEQILAIKQPELFQFLYRAINTFFKNIDQQLRSTKQTNQSSKSQQLYNQLTQQIQHFKIYRLILLQQSISQNFNLTIGNNIYFLLLFIDNNFEYLQFCGDNTIQILLEKCLKVFTQVWQEKCLLQLMKIIWKISKGKQRMIKRKIYQSNFNKLLNILASGSIKVKEVCLKIIDEVVIEREQVYQICGVHSDTDFQTLLKSFLKNLNDNDILMQIIKLSLKFVDLTDFQCGRSLITTISECLLLKDGQLGNEAYKIVQYCEIKYNKNCRQA